MGLQKHHDLPDGFLIGPAGGDALDPLGTDAVECAQPLGSVLDDIEDLLTERRDQLLGEMRADAFDHAAAKVFLDAFERAGRQDLQEGRPELQAVLAVSVPPAAGLDEPPPAGSRRPTRERSRGLGAPAPSPEERRNPSPGCGR